MSITKVVAILAVLVTPVLAVPIAAGMMARNYHEAALDGLAESWKGKIEVTLEEYRLGWLSSTASVRLRPLKAKEGVLLEETIWHGPFPLGDTGEGKLPKPGLALMKVEWRPGFWPGVSEALGDQPMLRVVTRVAWDRKVTMDFDSPAISNGTVDWKGVNGRALFANGAGWGRVEAPALHLTGAKPVHMEAMKAEFRVRTSRTGFPLGDWQTSLGNLEVGELNSDDHLVVRGLSLSQSTEERSPDVVDAVLRAALERLFADGQEFGPGSFEIGVHNLDLVVLSVLRSKLELAAEKSAPASAAGAIVMKNLPALLERGPTFELTRAQLSTPAGQLDWSGRVWIDDPPAGGKLKPLELLTKLRIDARLVTPARWLHELVDHHVATALKLDEDGPNWSRDYVRVAAVRSELFERWRSEAGLMRDGDSYVAGLRLSEGRLRLNGIAFDPSRLPMDIAMSAQRMARQAELERNGTYRVAPANGDY